MLWIIGWVFLALFNMAIGALAVGINEPLFFLSILWSLFSGGFYAHIYLNRGR